MVEVGDHVLTWKEIRRGKYYYLRDWEGVVIKMEDDKVRVKQLSTGAIEWFPLSNTGLDSRWNYD